MAKSKALKTAEHEIECLKAAIVATISGAHISVAIDQAGLTLDKDGQPVLK
jgi:hypothetical protein